MGDSTPQLENGYTRLANELLDALLLAGLTARQWAVVMAVIRKTYGFNKKVDEIGLSQLSAMTGIDKSHLSRTVRELESLGVLTRSAGVHGHLLGLNKQHALWGAPQQLGLPIEPQWPNRPPGGAQTATPQVAESATEGVPKQQPQKTRLKNTGKTTPKDTGAEALAERFERFYQAYPKKRNRAQAEKAFAKLAPDDGLLHTMLEAVEVAKRSRDDWRKEGGQFIPYAASWLGARGWEDEPDQIDYAPPERAVIEAYNAHMPHTWPRAIAAPFTASRAAAIREFLGLAPSKPGMPARYFEYCAAFLQPDMRFGFDWLIRRETYVKVREGAVKQRETV